MRDGIIYKVVSAACYVFLVLSIIPTDCWAQEVKKDKPSGIINDLDKPTTNLKTDKEEEIPIKTEEKSPDNEKKKPSEGRDSSVKEPVSKENSVDASKEGFIVESDEKISNKTDGKKIKKLIDDPGAGEIVYRKMVEVNIGAGGGESISLNTGIMAGASALYQFKGEFWGGAGFNLMTNGGEGYFDRIWMWGLSAEARYYFMPHQEANRFVLAHLLIELGYSSFHSSGDGATMETTGLTTALGLGVGKALSTSIYIGFKFKYIIPFWGELDDSGCGIGGCGIDTKEFDVKFWQFSAYISYGF